MNTSLKRLKDLMRKTTNYSEFELKVMTHTKWYLVGLETWTKASLWAFYSQNGGK